MSADLVKCALDREEIERYSRQLILPEVGCRGQEKLKGSKVLVVGAGGLGCPVAINLASAGIGTIGVVDYDVTERSNLHRQFLHDEAAIGSSKAQSVCVAIARLNSSVLCVPHCVLLSSKNALDLVSRYDIVVDCTDNVPTRYLLSDACVLAERPLVSGSALRWEGQLTVYHLNGGPCYRCIFPTPPPPETVSNCSDAGVVGVVPSIIGSMQALEVIKIALGVDSSFVGRLLLFDGLSATSRTVKLRGRRAECSACGDAPTLSTALVDYEAFCRTGSCDKVKPRTLLADADRISVREFASMRHGTAFPPVVVDVRPPIEFEIAHLPEAINVPLETLSADNAVTDSLCKKLQEPSTSCVVICHRGNDSQLAVVALRERFKSNVRVNDVVGGLDAWAREIDENFPVY